MGNSEINNIKENKKNISIDHHAFQNAKLVKTTNNTQLIQITVSMKSEKEYLEWTKNLRQIPKVNAVMHPEQTKFENQECCGSSGTAFVQYLRYLYTLSKEIEIRKNNKQQKFVENELWQLLLSLVHAGEVFHARKLKVGDIRPQNIFMNSEGQIKVLSQYSYPYGQTNYEKSITNWVTTTYLAPEEVKDIQLGKIKDTNDPLTVQTFSMGLTVLDAALLSSSQKLYAGNGVFNFDKLKEKLNLLAQLEYSPQLIHIITKMCEYQPSNRLKANQILKILKPFESEILSRKPFNVKSLPIGIVEQKNHIIINPEQKNLINETNKIQKKGEYTFVTGVIFDTQEDVQLHSSLMNEKNLLNRTSKTSNNFKTEEKDETVRLNAPVQTTVYYPPVTIQVPPPINNGAGHNNSH